MDQSILKESKSVVLFDLDGVILDSRSNMDIAWQAVRERLDVSVTFDDYFANIGLPFAEIMKNLALSELMPEIENIFRVTSARHLDETPFYPGVEASLLQLVKGGYKIGVVTSKDEFRTKSVLTRLPVKFDTVQTPGEHYRGKPAPDHLLVAMAETNTDPGNAIYVGDMNPDWQAAERAGINYIHAAWGYGPPAPDHFPVAANMAELLQFIMGEK